MKCPQTDEIVERLHKTRVDECYRITFREKIYTTLTELHVDVERWLTEYNEVRLHQGRWCYGCSPMQTFLETIPLA